MVSVSSVRTRCVSAEMRPLSDVVEEADEENGAAVLVVGRKVALSGGGAYELCVRDSGCWAELVCFSSSCRRLLSASVSLSSAWKVFRAMAASTSSDVLSCLSRCPHVASNSNAAAAALLSLAAVVAVVAAVSVV